MTITKSESFLEQIKDTDPSEEDKFQRAEDIIADHYASFAECNTDQIEIIMVKNDFSFEPAEKHICKGTERFIRIKARFYS